MPSGAHFGSGVTAGEISRRPSRIPAPTRADTEIAGARATNVITRARLGSRAHRLAAELLGTFVLVFFAVGSAVFGLDRIGPVGVALAFGLVLMALVYAIGPISGCHVNPAVTLGVLLRGGIGAREAGEYAIAQILGAAGAGGLLRLLVAVGGVQDQTGALGTNSWGPHINLFGALVVELLLTFLLVLVVLRVSR